MSNNCLFKIYIKNRTGATLEIMDKELQMEGLDKDSTGTKEGCMIKPGENIMVLGIRAAGNMLTDIECSCTWMDKSGLGNGSLTLMLDVPFWD